ncbi:MAG: recombinase family protein, partial [Chloroflexota bacterium]|nr:recombinase family protein [Chloroflexota bacterium]
MSIRRAVAAVGRSRPQHAAIYCRISDDRVGAGLGVARQEEDCRALARGTGWSVARVYTDNDLSAYSGKRRPAYRTLLEDIKSGGLDGVLAWHPDRLHRSPRELEEFIDAVDVAGIPILTVQAGQYDLSTATGRMTARIAGAVARHESEHKSERVRRKHEELAQGGMVSGGGDRPFGYDDDRTTIRASEAALLSDAARRVLAGESIRGIVREWNSRGIRTTAGRPWYTTALRRLLVSGRIAGQREHNGEIVGPAVWKGIIKPIESARLRA